VSEYLQPLTFTTTGGTGTVWVDLSASRDIGGSMEIGGDTCHLCGARIASRTTEEWQGKRFWKTSREVQYECGTSVFTNSKGKNLVYVGSDCIRMKGVV